MLDIDKKTEIERLEVEITYAHLGSEAPQSAQTRLSGWFKRSLILLLPVKPPQCVLINHIIMYNTWKSRNCSKSIEFTTQSWICYTWARLAESGCIIAHCSSFKTQQSSNKILHRTTTHIVRNEHKTIKSCNIIS